MEEKMKEIADGNYTESIKDGVTLVDFYANWCMPCLRMQSEVETFQEANPNVNVFKYDVDKGVNIWSNVKEQFKVRSIPFVVIYKDGEVATSAIGYKTADQLQEILDNI
jgi:thioredoxin 1